MYTTVHYAAAGFGYGLFTAASFAAGQWTWMVLLFWIAVSVIIMMIGTTMLAINSRRFNKERRIAATQTIPQI